jgi:hypothetical protein
MLATEVLTEDNVLGQRRKLITVGSRATNQIAHVYGVRELPELQASHPMVELYMKKADKKGHEGVIPSLHRSRRDMWIISGRSVA